MKKILTTLVLVVILGSCSPKDESSSIFSDQVCGKSCWNNIIVGKTDQQEFLNIISTLPNVVQASISVANYSDGGLFDGQIVFKWYRDSRDQDSLVHIAARIKDEKVVLLLFQGNLGLTFQEVVDAFGDPDVVSYSLWTPNDGINLHFINSTQGVEILKYFKSETSLVTPDTELTSVSLFDANQYQTYLESDLLIGDYKEYILYPWTGYGNIEDLYWPPR
jgi:hypothetical protein